MPAAACCCTVVDATHVRLPADAKRNRFLCYSKVAFLFESHILVRGVTSCSVPSPGILASSEGLTKTSANSGRRKSCAVYLDYVRSARCAVGERLVGAMWWWRGVAVLVLL